MHGQDTCFDSVSIKLGADRFAFQFSMHIVYNTKTKFSIFQKANRFTDFCPQIETKLFEVDGNPDT